MVILPPQKENMIEKEADTEPGDEEKKVLFFF